MDFLKNPELKKELLCIALLTLGFSAAGWFVSPLAGLLPAAMGLLILAVHLIFARKRYRAMEELAQSVDGILYGRLPLFISHSKEGELAILESEIEKMTVKLREQTETLAAQRSHLANAMADVSHQIRTPLTALNLTVSILCEEDLSPERRLQLTRDLKRQLEKIGWLVETLLKLSKLDAGSVRFAPEQIRVSDLLHRAAQSLYIPIELRGQTLRDETGNAGTFVDPTFTAEALGNVLKNCTEHAGEGVTIVVSAVETPLYCEIVVEDDGPGFAPEDLPMLFERFYRGKNASAESVGIGLALSRMIVSAQNGVITAENRKEGGARFRIKFYSRVI